MSFSSRTARPLLASVFIGGGLDAYRNPESKVKAAETVTKPISARIDFIPDDTATLVKINGGVQVVAGSLLALGKFRRLSALVLIGSIIPTTYAGHRFWDEVDDEKRAQQQVHFLKNLGLLGGLILAAADTEGAPSTAWRLRRRVRDAGSAVHSQRSHVRAQAGPALHKATKRSRRAIIGLNEMAGKEVVRAHEVASHLMGKAEDYLPTH